MSPLLARLLCSGPVRGLLLAGILALAGAISFRPAPSTPSGLCGDGPAVTGYTAGSLSYLYCPADATR